MYLTNDKKIYLDNILLCMNYFMLCSINLLYEPVFVAMIY